MNLSKLILKAAGWKVEVTTPNFDKCLICVAPHTSNWDFILGLLAYNSVGRKAGFLMKDSWFFFPLGYFFKMLGGIPVARKNKKGSLVDAIIHKFNNTNRLQIAITPEGTRSRTSQWHTGFLKISYYAGIPCLLGAIDAKSKTITVNDVFYPSGNTDEDMQKIKHYYRNFTGIHPENFTTEDS